METGYFQVKFHNMIGFTWLFVGHGGGKIGALCPAGVRTMWRTTFVACTD
jgi:hypothetical protein